MLLRSLPRCAWICKKNTLAIGAMKRSCLLHRNISSLNVTGQSKPHTATEWLLPWLQGCRFESTSSKSGNSQTPPSGSASASNKYAVRNPYSMDVDSEPNNNVVDVTSPSTKYWSSLFQFWRAPAPALLTGLAGLIPFAAAPSYLYFYATSFYPFLVTAQLAYGALILSFVGGIRWGFVVPFRDGSTELVKWRSIIQSIVPPVIAWGGLMTPDLTGGLLMVSAGLCIALYNDLRLFGDYPKWMMGLRCLLTTIAVVTLLASVVLVEENRLKNAFGKRVQSKLLDKEI